MVHFQSADLAMRSLIGTGRCCARAATGHAAAPPSRRVDEGVAPPHPSQIRMCRFPASGSSWESLARSGVDDTIRDSLTKESLEGLPSFPLLPVQLTVVVSWTGLRDPKFSPMFPVNGSLRMAPLFPRSGPGESGSPMSQVLLRRHACPVTYLLRFRGPRDPPRFVSRSLRSHKVGGAFRARV